MEAKNVFSNYKGNITANLYETVDLKNLLSQSGYETSRFEPIGIDISIKNGEEVMSVICHDNLYSTPGKLYTTKCKLKSQNFSGLKLFKDLGISLFMNHIDYKNLKIDESVIVFQDEESKSNDNNEFSFFKVN